MYDLIGDIHGHATELKALLHKLGYRKQNGVWQHPEQRQVIFLGDFVDRGPEQVEVVDIARNMVEQGKALAVMGNHEYNAVAWATEDPENPGQFLRKHNDKNRDQHQAFLEQVGEGSPLHMGIIDWFKTLPLYLGLPELRVVHACWHPKHLAVMGKLTDDENRLLPEAWIDTARKGSAAYNALETLLKGWEIFLPEGYVFHDGEGNPRHGIRTRWWAGVSASYRDLAIVPDKQVHNIPDDQQVSADQLPGYDNEKPLFVGHYWLRGEPAPLTPAIACLDYSVVDQKAGKLCAYRFDANDGPQKPLSRERFVWVERNEAQYPGV
ncbi:MAG: metallophosphoesterase [Natronospirillum sp.]|uniref:metallophosphoesterase n=1 Tax=Natronospirillum sp. TaxID=2812955 RepID=UPI0025CC4010|nr:metallophosphoesterase [Natronospirillum sp.]MCH8553116.1 metallophosphoesterase [Natronospirillum sp.]